MFCFFSIFVRHCFCAGNVSGHSNRNQIESYMKKIVLLNTLLLTALALIWEILYYKFELIPIRYIPGTPIGIFGLLIFGLVIGFNIHTSKKLYKSKIITSVISLTFLGAIATIVAFLSIQLYRYTISVFNNESFDYIASLQRTFILIVIAIFISFLISFQIATKRTGIMLAILAIFIVIFAVWKGIIKT